jgi:hypothetical protein
MRRDVLSAYAASAAKILSWVIVSGLLYRYIDIAEFAMLALVRGTIGILNYTSFGLSPAMIRIVAERKTAPTPQGGSTLSYYAPALRKFADHRFDLRRSCDRADVGLRSGIHPDLSRPHSADSDDALGRAVDRYRHGAAVDERRAGIVAAGGGAHCRGQLSSG